VGRAGTQARISVSAMNQRDNFLRCAVIDVLVQLSGIYSGCASWEFDVTPALAPGASVARRAKPDEAISSLLLYSPSSTISFTLPT
jgi:hypothetical protein